MRTSARSPRLPAGPEPSGTASTGALARPRFLMLLLAALAVSMAYGVTLPLLSDLLAPLPAGPAAARARHTGWLTAAYTLAVFAFSPAWGALSDRADRRWIIALGLVGSGLALWATELARSLPGLYAARIAAGALSAAVLPAVFAYVVETTPPAGRQRRFAWIASATALGFLLGPVAADLAQGAAGAVSALQLVALACAAAAAMVCWLPAARRLEAPAGQQASAAAPTIAVSLVLTCVVVFGITIAEVGLTLTGVRVSVYFAICSGVMVGVQLFAYPRLESWLGEPRMVVAAFAVMAAGVGWLAVPVGWAPAVAFPLAATGIGILIPALAVRISLAAGARQGSAMGKQAAAANLGQAAGAASAGMLFAAAPPAPFLLAALLLALGGVLATAGVRAARRPPSGTHGARARCGG